MASALTTEQQEVSQAEEKHYTVKELADRWKLKADTVRKLFYDEPGVFRIGHESIRRKTRSYVTMRIPHSVMLRVYYSRVQSAN